MTNSELGFRPSNFGDLDACIHHESKEGDSEARTRGTGTHVRIAEVLREIQGKVPATLHKDTPEIVWAVGIVVDYLKQGWHIFAIEQTVDILNEFGEKITQGTIDLVLERNGDYLIVDWKTGDKGRHELQVHGYGAGFMDLYPQAQSVQGQLAYVDLRETVPVYLSYAISSTNTLLLYDKWKEKERHPYVIGTQCDWCALRPTCPAWAKAATTAFDQVNYLALNPATGLPQGGSMAPAAVNNLKNDPHRLEEFVLAWERAKTLVETDWNLKDALKTHIQTGFKAEHHILVNIKDKTEVVRSINPEEFLEKVAHKIGYMQSARAIVVDADIAYEVWQKFYGYGDKAKFPVEVKETIKEVKGYSYIRAKGKAGQGDARRKRKDLE
jgi:hypothetical protein